MRARLASGLDLNLLRVLAAILEHGSVSRAASALGSSQPVVSRQLAKLRTWFDDPLLLRRGSAWVRTERGHAIEEEVRAIFERIDGLLAKESDRAFDPRAPQTVSILTADYASLVLLPALAERLASSRISLSIQPWKLAYGDALASGEVSLVIAPATTKAPASIRRRRLLEDGFIVLARAQHPALAGHPSVEALCRCEWVQVAPDGRPGSLIDDALAGTDARRFVRIVVPSFGELPALLASSDRIAIVPTRVAAALSTLTHLATYELPLELPTFGLDVFWHSRTAHSRTLAWIRGHLLEVASAKRRTTPGRVVLHDAARRRRGTL